MIAPGTGAARGGGLAAGRRRMGAGAGEAGRADVTPRLFGSRAGLARVVGYAPLAGGPPSAGSCGGVAGVAPGTLGLADVGAGYTGRDADCAVRCGIAATDTRRGFDGITAPGIGADGSAGLDVGRRRMDRGGAGALGRVAATLSLIGCRVGLALVAGNASLTRFVSLPASSFGASGVALFRRRPTASYVACQGTIFLLLEIGLIFLPFCILTCLIRPLS
jgi:hypothetical protein